MWNEWGERTLKSAVAEPKLIPLGRVGDGGMRGLKSISRLGMTIGGMRLRG